MAHILDFEIEGLVGRDRPVSLKLNRDVNVFFGLNGSGKTTLLKILHSALSTDTDVLGSLPFKRAQVTVWLNRYGAPFKRTFGRPDGDTPAEASPSKLEPIPLTGDGLPEERSTPPRAAHWTARSVQRVLSRPKWASDPPEPEGGLTHQRGNYLSISRLYRNLRSVSGARRLSDKELDDAFVGALQARWSEYYGDIAQEITKVQEKGFAKILGFFLSGESEESESIGVPSADDAYARIERFLKRQPASSRLIPSKKKFSSIYDRRPELQSVVKQIDTVEKRIDEITAPRDRFLSIMEGMFTGNKHLLFSEKEIEVELADHQKIGLSLLSSGEKQLLFIALHVLTCGSASVFIDEPELSMHVDWQKRLVTTLGILNPRVQQIMATHSPEVMADLPDSKVFQL